LTWTTVGNVHRKLGRPQLMTKNLSEIFSLVVASEILATRPSQGVGPGPRNRALTEEQCISITAVNKVRNSAN
jgi:hypothetical protein